MRDYAWCMARLTAAARRRLPASAFVYPKARKYPIHDRAHGRAALSRVSAHGTAAQKARVRAAVRSRYPGMGSKKRRRRR